MSGLLTNRNIQAFPNKTKQKEHFCFAKEPPLRLSQRRDRFHYGIIEHRGLKFASGQLICRRKNLKQKLKSDEGFFVFMTPILSQSTDCSAAPHLQPTSLQDSEVQMSTHNASRFKECACTNKTRLTWFLKGEDCGYLSVKYLTSNLHNGSFHQ